MMNLNPHTKAGRQTLARAATFVTVITMLAMLLGGMPALTPTAHAMSPSWPSNESEVWSHFNVQDEGGCATTVKREGTVGFEVHGSHFRISPGSQTLIVILHLNPDHYSWLSQQAEPHGDNGVGGERWEIPAGQQVTLDVRGDCDTGLSLYPLAPTPSSSCSAWPRDEAEARSCFGVNNADVVREGPVGFEFHSGGNGSASSIGRDDGPTCIDFDPTGGQGVDGADFFQDVNAQWRRVRVPAGRRASWHGYNASVYGDECHRV